MTFPVWTRSGLAQVQEYKRSVLGEKNSFLQQRDEALQKMQDGSSNLLQKALLYREAALALEKAFRLDARGVDMIPTPEDSVDFLSSDLVLTKHGTVWTKEGGFASDG